MLNLDFTKKGDVVADELVKGLKENSTLTSLHLSGSQNIGEVAADALAETLKENLTTLSDDSLMSEYPTRQGSINCTKILYGH